MPSYFQTRQAELREGKKPKKTTKKATAALPDDLSEMTLKDLKKLAAEVGIEGRSSMDKKQLVKALG